MWKNKPQSTKARRRNDYYEGLRRFREEVREFRRLLDTIEERLGKIIDKEEERLEKKYDAS